MNLTSLLGLFGGLALFLYGMHMMSNGFKIYEEQNENNLRKTSNRLAWDFW